MPKLGILAKGEPLRRNETLGWKNVDCQEDNGRLRQARVMPKKRIAWSRTGGISAQETGSDNCR